jgi:hypothetical protein
MWVRSKSNLKREICNRFCIFFIFSLSKKEDHQKKFSSLNRDLFLVNLVVYREHGFRKLRHNFNG